MANTAINGLHRKLCLGYWSLDTYLKHKVNNAVNYIRHFEQAVSNAAQRHEVDSLVCGHIHHAVIRDINDTLYANCGDWVESFTALAAHHNGSLELIRWQEQTLLTSAQTSTPKSVAQ